MNNRKPPFNCPEYRPGKHGACLECNCPWLTSVHDHLRAEGDVSESEYDLLEDQVAGMFATAAEAALMLSGWALMALGAYGFALYMRSGETVALLAAAVLLAGGVYLTIFSKRKG